MLSRLARYHSGSVRSLHMSARTMQKVALSTPELTRYNNYYTELSQLISEPTTATQSAGLVTLHRRLALPASFELSTLSKCLTCRSSQMQKVGGVSVTNDNHGLNIFGKNLLTYQVTAELIKQYPRLPTVILNAAVDAYIGETVLASIGKSWGIETERSTVLERFLKNEPLEQTLGRLRFNSDALAKESGVEVISHTKSDEGAYALAVRSIIASLWAYDAEAATKFIKDHILSRKLDITKMFQFEQPTRELAALCRREGLEQPVSKLLAESGRASKAPVFIVGVYSGQEQLGEGFGSSLKEAKARAATDALMKWYCFESVTEGVVDHGVVVV